MQPNLSAVRARRASIARQLDQLRTEDKELAAAEDVLLRLSRGGSASGSSSLDAKRAGDTLRLGASSAADKRQDTRQDTRQGARPGKAVAGKTASKQATSNRSGRGRASNAGSQRELVLAALKKPGAGWMNVKQIIASVRESSNVDIPPRSLSPLLSNLKNAGALVRQGRRVAAPERARER